MTLDGHEDWVRWGRNRVGLWGRHAASGWGWNQKKINMMRFVGVFGGWKVFASAVFFSHGCQHEIMDCTYFPTSTMCKGCPLRALPFGKRHPPADVCYQVCRWLYHTSDMVSIHTNTHAIFDVYIYIYIHISMYMPTKRIHLIYHLHG